MTLIAQAHYLKGAILLSQINFCLRSRQMKKMAVILSVVVLCAVGAKAQPDEPLKLVQTIPLSGLQDGDFDHFALDLPGQRLFLCAEENGAVEVIDLHEGKVVQTLRDTKTPHSMAYDTESKKLFVLDEGPPNRVAIFEGNPLKLSDSIPTDAHTDASIFDAANHMLYAGNGGRMAHEDFCLLTMVDTKSGKKVGEIKLDSDHIEAMAIEKSGPRMFVNLTDKSAVAVIDREKRTVLATWPNGDGGKANGPMAFDEANHRLFVVSRNPNNVIVLDTDSGKIVAVLPSTGQFISDDAVYDPGSKRLYVAGTPFINVFQQRSPNGYQLLGQVPTSYHSNTALLVPQLHRYYVAVNHHGNVDAKVQVYELVE